MPRSFGAVVLAWLVLCGAVGTQWFAAPVGAVEPGYSSTGPHADAVRLVAERRADEILALDGGADARWFDTRVRTWATQRPIGPGGIDSRFVIQVTYAIDGKVVGRWTVNTCSGEISGAGDPPIAIEGCGAAVERTDSAAGNSRP